jgi:hypothetical protein
MVIDSQPGRHMLKATSNQVGRKCIANISINLGFQAAATTIDLMTSYSIPENNFKKY